jgi:CHAT domain-containing protein/Tfp pilus assembly protein PilF
VLKKLVPASVVLLAGHLLLGGMANAQTRAASTSPTSVPASAATQEASHVLAHARQLYLEEGARVALPEFEKALALFRQQKDERAEAVTLGLIGNCYKKLGDHARALEYLQQALAMKRKLGDRVEEGKTLSHLGLLHWEMGQYPQAIEYFNKAIALGSQLGDRVLEASAHNNLGLVHDELGEYRRSLDEYNHALELYKGTDFERGISDAIGNLGGTNLLLGEYKDALRYYQQALAIDERLRLKAETSLDLGNIALCYLGLGRVAEAMQHFDRALKLAREASLKKEEALWQKGKGSALVQIGKYTEALDQYRQALQTYEQAELKQPLIEALGDLGALEVRLGDGASAEKDFRRALDLSRTIGHARGITVILISLGNLEWRRKRFNEAATLYRDALARASEMQDRASTATARIQLAFTYRDLKQLEQAAQEAKQAREIAHAIEARPLELEVLYAQGEVERARNHHEEALKYYLSGEEIVRETADPELIWRLAYGRGQSLVALQRNEEALAAYQSAVRTIESVRSELREERFRAGYIEDKYQVYVALVELLLKLKRVSEAFSIAERLRARSYLELLDRGQPPIRSEAQRQTEVTLRSRIRLLQRQFEEVSSKARPEKKRQAFELFSKELSEAEHNYQNFLDDLLPSDPAYASVRALRVPSPIEVQQQLPRGTALIEYVLAEDDLVIFVLTSDGLHASTVPIRSADLQAKVELLRDLMLRKNTNEWQLPSASLYKTLIEPIEAAGWLRDVNRLYVVPHAILHYLPFAALVRHPGNRSKVLIDDYTLAYLPAAATLVYRDDPSGTIKSVLALAPANTGLTYARQESQDISNFFPQQHKVLVGSQATESSFKRLADQYDVIHLATHGYFNKLNPLLSGVMLEPDAQEDGRMEVHEILGLKLNAKLVTLSACDTALGSGYFAEVPAGDDFIGLTRAFLFAGTPSVLASLWEVNDRSAVTLMHSFYGHLRQTDKATALARAQRSMRSRSKAYTHPYFWSSFVLVGQMN